MSLPKHRLTTAHSAGLTGVSYAADSKHAQADSGFFQRREFCFTMDGDIFIRYQSFKV